MLAFCGRFSTLEAIDRQLQFSTYFDSNVRESLVVPYSTFGLTMRGRLSHEYSRPRLNIYGEILTQANLDAIFPGESKLIVNTELDFRYALYKSIYILGQLSHFQKSFYNHTGSYLMTEYGTFLQFSPIPRYSGWLGYRHREKTLETADRFRFGENNFEFRGRYNISSKGFIESTITGINIIHSDFNAIGVADDTLLVPLGYPQEDRGVEGLLHLRYLGKKNIMGLQVGIGDVGSNSVIGGLSFVSYQAYLTGQLSPSMFYHVVFRRIDKEYQYPALEGESRYRDPEEPIQNLTHIRLEKVLNGSCIGYVQMSLLQNETIYNHRFYDKTMIEIGVKYEP